MYISDEATENIVDDLKLLKSNLERHKIVTMAYFQELERSVDSILSDIRLVNQQGKKDDH